MPQRLDRRIQALSVLGLVTVLPLAYWPPFHDCFPLAKWLVLLAFGLVSILRLSSGSLHPALAWAPFWVAWVAVSAAHSPVSPWRAVPEAFLLAVPVLAAARGLPLARLRKTAFALAGVSALIASHALWQAFGGESEETWISPFHKGVAGTIGNPDLLGGFLIIPFALSLSRALRRGAAWGWRAAAAVIGLAVIGTEARAAWLGAACAFLVLLPGAASRLKAAGLALILTVLAVAVSPQARERILSTSALTERIWTWKVAARSAREAPLLGCGTGSFRRVYLKGQAHAREEGKVFYHYSEYAHLEPLHLMVETGAIGLGLMVWGLICAFRLMASGSLRRLDPVLWHGIEAGAVGFLANSAFSFPLHVPPTVLPFWLLLFAGAYRRAPVRAYPLWRELPAAAVLFLILVPALRLGTASVCMRSGQMLGRMGDLDGAVRRYEVGSRLDPGDVRLAWHAGAAARRRGDLEKALSWLDRGLKLEPDFCELNHERGQTLKELGRLGEAENSYRAALRANPSFPHAWNNLGNLLGAQGRFEEAEDAQRRALELMPESRQTRQNLALTLMRLGRDAEARRVLAGGR